MAFREDKEFVMRITNSSLEIYFEPSKSYKPKIKSAFSYYIDYIIEYILLKLNERALSSRI